MSSSATTVEKREVNGGGLLLPMFRCVGVQPRLLLVICIHLAWRHDIMTSENSISDKFSEITKNFEIPAKKTEIPANS